ncbi:MAG TPA: toxin-antitoxin system HicB family antitoxin [Candidatus Nanopelagicales bacterium]|nr:toxin-antitoxin system HicB family antitoxin [Candidatus Nanopelagicales bacterium]
MDLTPYVAAVRAEFLSTAEAGGPETRATAERLVAGLDSAARLALLEVLSAAAAEITAELAPASVEVRLRGREPELVVLTPPAPPEPDPAPEPTGDDDSPLARINLRLPQDLKDRVEEAARGTGVSVNTWLVRAASAGLTRPATTGHGPSVPGGTRFSGWVR